VKAIVSGIEEFVNRADRILIIVVAFLANGLSGTA
jgi:hypothetical protein